MERALEEERLTVLLERPWPPSDVADGRPSPRWARPWGCPSCTSLTHSQPGLADGPIRGSLGTSAVTQGVHVRPILVDPCVYLISSAD